MMDPFTALCLSVPPSLALVVATFVLAKEIRIALVDAADRLANVVAESVTSASAQVSTTLAAAATSTSDLLADAIVKAARYQSGAIRARPRAETPEAKTVFQQWLAAEGRERPLEVQDRVEAAFGFIAGEDSGSEMGEAGTAEGAREIIDEDAGAGWYALAVADAKRRR